MNRGRRGEEIFPDKKSYETFIDLLKKVGVVFEIEKFSKVSSLSERVKQETGRNKNFKKCIYELTCNFNKSQRQT